MRAEDLTAETVDAVVAVFRKGGVSGAIGVIPGPGRDEIVFSVAGGEQVADLEAALTPRLQALLHMKVWIVSSDEVFADRQTLIAR